MKEPKKKQDPAIMVKERKDEATNWQVLRQIQISRSFYKGNQWIAWDGVKKSVYTPPVKPGEKRYTYNKIKPVIKTLLSKLTKSRIQMEVHPDTNDDERIEVAKAGHKYLKYQWAEDKMDHKSTRLKFLMLIDGMPALKIFADKTKGEDIPESDEYEDTPTKTGKIITLVRDQMSLFIDPTAEDIEEIKWVVEEFPKDVDEIEDEYNKIVEPEAIEMRQTFDYGMFNDAKKKYPNHAMVREYWELPCSKYPEGRKICTANGILLDETDKPGEFPYIFFPLDPSPGSAIATGVVTDMTTPQLSYNVKRTAEARILEEMGIGKWTVPVSSVEDEEEINDEIGGIVHYTPVNGMKPQREAGIEPGNGWQSAMERDEKDMEDISGAHEISQGAMPKGLDTFGGMQLMVEQDETKLAIAAHSYETGIKLWGEKVLRLVQKHFPEEQQLSIVGENGEVDAFTFAGADLSGHEVVDVIPNSSMPEIKAVKEQKIMAMWGAGMFINPKTGQPDTRKVTRMLGQTISSAYFDDAELHENKAKMEQRQWELIAEDEQSAQALAMYGKELMDFTEVMELMQQLPPEEQEELLTQAQPPQPPMKIPTVRDFYDHAEHLECHNRFRLSDLYDNLPPELQYVIDSHCQEHEQALMAPQIAEQQQMQAQQQATDEKEKQTISAKEKSEADKHSRELEKEVIKSDLRAQEKERSMPALTL